MTFERTKDYELVRKIITHPKIYPHVSDDGSSPVSDYQPPEADAFWYVLVRDEGEVLGLFAFMPQNAVCYEVHTCLLPRAWGATAARASRGVAAWMFEHSPAQRIVTNVPENNRLALRFAKQAGMTVFGTNNDSFLKDGKLHSQIMLGISKDQSCQ